MATAYGTDAVAASGMDGDPTPAPGPGGPQEEVLLAEQPAMSHEDLEAAFSALREAARSYNDRLAEERAEALRLYNGRPFGDEEEGRSQVVLTDVQDTIAAVIPTVIRTFAGSERPVLFDPQKEGDEEAAAQATEYVHHVIFEECDGFRAIHDAALDACQLKVGWIRWWWDTSVQPVTERYSGLLEPQCAALIGQDGVRALRVARRPANEDDMLGLQASPEGAMVKRLPGVPLLLYDVMLVRKVEQARPRVEAVPAESVWIDPDASGPDDARGIFIVSEVAVSELVALGFDEDEVLRYQHDETEGRSDKVKRARDRTASQATRDHGTKANEALRRVTYTEGWIRVDWDGDGIAELRRVEAVGQTGNCILKHEPAPCVPLARFVPFAVAHKAVGMSFADRVGDLQRINSHVFRNILDSMTESIHPRTVIEDGAVPIDDVLNTEMGAVIRERKPGAVRELTKPFIGSQALPLLEVTAMIREQRTGITRGSQGFNAETLQSTAPIAVSAQISAAQDRIELTLRWFAEGMRAVYQGVLAMMAEHQDRARAVRLRGKWVPVDPRSWLNSFSVQAKVALGRGSMGERISVLGTVAGKQEQILSTYGPGNPLVTVGQYRATLADMLATAGISTPERYFQEVPLDWQPPPAPPQPSPDQLLAQVEVEKSRNQAQGAQAAEVGKLVGKLLDDDRERDKARIDAILRSAEIAAKYPEAQATTDPRAISGLLERDHGLTVLLNRLLVPAEGQPQAGLAPGSPPPGPDAGIPPGPPVMAPKGGPPPSLADARAFLPPQLITALARARAAEGPPVPSLMGMGPPQGGRP